MAWTSGMGHQCLNREVTNVQWNNGVDAQRGWAKHIISTKVCWISGEHAKNIPKYINSIARLSLFHCIHIYIYIYTYIYIYIHIYIHIYVTRNRNIDWFSFYSQQTYLQRRLGLQQWLAITRVFLLGQQIIHKQLQHKSDIHMRLVMQRVWTCSTAQVIDFETWDWKYAANTANTSW